MRSLTTRLLLIFLVVSALAVGLAGSAAATVEGPPAPPQSQVLVLEPTNSTLRPDEQQVFTAFSGPPDQNGDPDVGDDGVPGTSDDQFQAVSVDWSTNGGIGTVNPTSGTSTTLTAALTFVPLVGDLLAFHADGRTASANVTVEPQPILVLEPTNSTLRPDEQQVFMAFSGPPNPDGTPDKGEDGVAGTADDDFQPADVSFSTSGGIGTLDPASGSTTTLTAGNVAASGQVIATHADGRTATSNVRVTAAALNIRTSPDTINLKAKGKYITTYIESGAGAVDVSQLDLASIRLQVVFPFGSSELPIAPGAPTAIGDDDGNGVADLAVKFDRASVQSWFSGPAEPIFRITAELLDVRLHAFGDAVARVIDQGSQHTSEDDHGSVQP